MHALIFCSISGACFNFFYWGSPYSYWKFQISLTLVCVRYSSAPKYHLHTFQTARVLHLKACRTHLGCMRDESGTCTRRVCASTKPHDKAAAGHTYVNANAFFCQTQGASRTERDACKHYLGAELYFFFKLENKDTVAASNFAPMQK